MKKLKIITDSSSSFTREEAEKFNMEIVPLNFIFGSETYADEDLTQKEFYEKLKNSEAFPKTSQPSPEQFVELFKKAEELNETVIAVFIGSGLSGTYRAALAAKEAAGYDDVHIIDSGSTHGVIRLIITEAVNKYEKYEISELCNYLEEFKKRIKLFAVVDTLEYLKKGGRLSAFSAFVGSVFKIKPLITVDDKVVVLQKTRGIKNAIEAMLKEAEAFKPDPEYSVIFAYSESEDNLNAFKEISSDFFSNCRSLTMPICNVVGVHTGPKAAAVIYVSK